MRKFHRPLSSASTTTLVQPNRVPMAIPDYHSITHTGSNQKSSICPPIQLLPLLPSQSPILHHTPQSLLHYLNNNPCTPLWLLVPYSHLSVLHKLLPNLIPSSVSRPRIISLTSYHLTTTTPNFPPSNDPHDPTPPPQPWSRTFPFPLGFLTIYTGESWLLPSLSSTPTTHSLSTISFHVLSLHAIHTLPAVGEALEQALAYAEELAAEAKTPAQCRTVANKIWTLRRALTRLRGDARLLQRLLPKEPWLDEARNSLIIVDEQVWEWRELAHSVLECVLAVQNNRMQETMQTLAVVTTIFVPLTFVAGIEGMNFVNQPELNGRWSYLGFWVVVVLLVTGQVVFFKRKQWI